MQHGQAVIAEPALVVARAAGGVVVVEVVPVAGGGTERLARAVVAGVAAVAIEVEAIGRGVVEDAIDDEVHAAGVQGGDEGVEVGLCAQRRVDAQVVVGVVAVVAAAVEDGRGVDGVEAGGLQVVELVDEALQVAAVELRAVLVLVRPRLARVADERVPRLAQQGVLVAVEDRAAGRAAGAAVVVALVAVAEAVGEDLVDDGVLQPGGRLEGGVVDGDLEALGPLAVAGRARAALVQVVVGAAVVVAVVVHVQPVGDGEVVVEDGRRGGRGQIDLPVGAPAGVVDEGHGVVHRPGGTLRGRVIGVDAQGDAVHVVGGGVEAQGHGRPGGHRAEGRAVVAVEAVVVQVVPLHVAVVDGVAPVEAGEGVATPAVSFAEALVVRVAHKQLVLDEGAIRLRGDVDAPVGPGVARIIGAIDTRIAAADVILDGGRFAEVGVTVHPDAHRLGAGGRAAGNLSDACAVSGRLGRGPQRQQQGQGQSGRGQSAQERTELSGNDHRSTSIQQRDFERPAGASHLGRAKGQRLWTPPLLP